MAWVKLLFDSYTVTRAIRCQEVEFVLDDPVLRGLAAKAKQAGFDNLTHDEQQTFAHHPLSYLKPAQGPEAILIEGTASLDDDKITLFSLEARKPDFRPFTSSPSPLPAASTSCSAQLQRFGVAARLTPAA